MPKRLILIALLIIGTAVSVARADPVLYSTSSDSIDPTSQTYTWFFGNSNTMQLTFLGKALSLVNTPSYASLGEFLITGLRGSDTFTSVPFDLTITQWLPPADDNSATFSSTIDGTISVGQSSATVLFDEPFVRIGDVVYTLTQQTYTLNADGLLPGKTTIEAEITTTPEPGSLLLLGTGIIILAFAFRRAQHSGMALNL